MQSRATEWERDEMPIGVVGQSAVVRYDSWLRNQTLHLKHCQHEHICA